MCGNGLHDITLPGSRRGGRCVECLRAKIRRAQARYERTHKGRSTHQRYWNTAKGQKVRFYQNERERQAAHAAALEELR